MAGGGVCVYHAKNSSTEAVCNNAWIRDCVSSLLRKPTEKKKKEEAGERQV